MNQQQTDKIEAFIEDFYTGNNKLQLDKWKYEDGCILTAAIQLYEAVGKELYRDFVLSYTDHYITPEGQIQHYNQKEYKLDDIAPGRALVFAYEQTGEKRYLNAIYVLLEQLEYQPRIQEGNYWHKKIYPNQVWLDGLYMAQPFRMICDTKFGKKEQYGDIVAQFRTVQKRMFHKSVGLYYHGYDESRSIFWADKETGTSENFWLRAIAWLMMGLIDTIEEMDWKETEYRKELKTMFKCGIEGILKYRDLKTGLFYQVVNHPEVEGNYLETSGSAMLAAAILKACRIGVLSVEKNQEIGEEILAALIDRRLTLENGHYTLAGTCNVAGLGPDKGRRDGSIAYYLSEPVGNNDSKGIAALFMAYAQYGKLYSYK